MKIPLFFMGKNIVTLFHFTDNPSIIKLLATTASVLQRHPGFVLLIRKVPKNAVFLRFLRGGFK